MAASQYYEQIQQAYLAYYGRPADPAGQAYWAQQLDNANGNLSAIINAFGTSAESTALYGGSSAAAQVNAIYEQLFGRQADVTGLNFYVNGLENGQFTLASIALNVFNGAQNSDLAELQAKEAYADAFTEAVGDSVSAQIAYSGTAASNAARAAVSGVTSTATEATAVSALPTTIANIGGTPVGQTYSLTTGVDNIAPTGNAVINATIGGISIVGSTATFSTGDTINATGANNTLNLVDVGTYDGPDGASYGDSLPGATTVSGVQTVNLISGGAVGAVDFTNFTGLTTLNVTEAGGAQDVVAAGTTVVNLTDTAFQTNGITVDGGSNVSITAAGAALANSFGNINVGSTTAPTGTVIVNATETSAGNEVTDFGNITVNGGTDVTVSLTENVGANRIDGQGETGITIIGATGAVTVNNTMNVGDTSGDFVPGASVTVSGGTTVIVNEVVTATPAADSALGENQANAQDGAVYITDGGTATSVTVNQTATKAVAATTAEPAEPAHVLLQAAPGITAVTTAAAPATAAVPGVVGVTANQVEISGGTTGVPSTSSLDASTTITSVALDNYGAGSYVNSAVLSTLTLAGSGGWLSIDNLGATDTTLALNLNGLDSWGIGASGVKTLNVTTADADSTLGKFVDSALTTLNVSGTNTLTLGGLSAHDANLTALNVSGAAGFNDGNAAGEHAGLAGFGSALTITDTSSGTFTAALDDTTQTFVGSTGRDVITISDLADATKAISAGSATNNELILDGGEYALTAATAKLVTGFDTIGVSSTVSGTINLSVLDATASSLDITGNNGVYGGPDGDGGTGAVTFDNVAVGASISLDADTSGAIAVEYVGATGATDSTAVTIGSATNATGIETYSLSLADSNGVGVGTVSIVSNDVSTTDGGNGISMLVDNGLSTLTVSGTGALTIGSINEASTQATSFTLHNTDAATAGVTIEALTDANLGAITFTGTGASTIWSLDGLTGKSLTLSNTGTGTATVSNISTAGSAGVTASHTLTVDGLNAGQSEIIAGVTVTAATGTGYTAAQVAAAIAGGADGTGFDGGLTVSGALSGWSVTTTANAGQIVLTSTTANTNVVAPAYSVAGVAAAAPVMAGNYTAGDGDTTYEHTTWTMSGLTDGQSYTLDGVTVTAQATLTATQVAAAFAAGTTDAGLYTVVSGAHTDGWTNSVFTSSGAELTLTDGSVTGAVAYNTAPTASTAGTVPTGLFDTSTVTGSAAGASAQSLQTINLSGDVALGANSLTASAAIGATTGVTVTGATDNAHVNITLNGAASGATDTIALGNGNDYVTDLSTSGNLTINVGTGSNLIDIHTSTGAGVDDITLGAHTAATGIDEVLVGTVAGNVSATATQAQTFITGAVKGDIIGIAAFAGTVESATVTANAQAGVNALTGANATLANAITAADSFLTGADHAIAFNFGGNTYVVETALHTGVAAGDTIVELQGVHTITGSAGHITLAS